MKYFRLIIVFLFFLPSLSFSQAIAFGEEDESNQYYFGFNLIPSAAGGLTHFVIIQFDNNGKRKVKQLSQDQFLRQIQGESHSIANPYKVNLLEKNQVNPSVLNDLWKLRYQEYLFTAGRDSIGNIVYKNEGGWSTNDSISFIPSPSQQEILCEFGIKRMSDFCYGENAFKLLHLLSDQNWLTAYKNSF